MSKQYAQQHATKRYTTTTVNRNNDEEERAAQRAEQIAQRQAERAAQQAAAAQSEAQRQAQAAAQQRAQRAAEVKRFTQYTGIPKRQAVDSYQAMVNTTAYKANSAGYSLQDYLSDMTRYRTNYDSMGYQQQYDMNLYQSYMNRLKADKSGDYEMSDSDRKLTAARAQAIKDRYTTPKGMYTATKEDDADADMTGRAWNQYLKIVQENRNRDPLTVKRYDERMENAVDLTDEQKKLGEDMVNTARTYSTALSMTDEDLKNATPMQKQAYEEAQRRVDEYRQKLKKTGVSDEDIDSMLQNGVQDPAARTVQENYEYNDDRLNQLDRQARTLLNRIVESNAQADQGAMANNVWFDVYGRTNAYADRNRAIELYKIHTGKSDEEVEKDIQAATELYNYNSMNALNQTLNEEVRNNPVLAGAGVSLISTALSPVRGMNAMTEVAKRGGRADTNAPVDTNSVGYLGTNLTNMGRGAVAQTIAGDGTSRFRNLAASGYQIGMSVADSGYSMLMAGAIGDALNVAALPEKAANAAMNMISLPGFGMDAAATQLQQDQNRGISADKALKRAVAAGVIEMATEVFSMDNFWDIVQKKGPAAARSALVNWFAQAGIEGSEEFASEILNGVADAMINGDQSEYNDNVRNYIEQGYSVEDARRKANGDFAKQAIGSFLGGAVSGGIMGGVGVYASHVRNVQSADQLKTVVQDENYKDLAEGIDTNRESYESDEAYNAAVDAKALAEKLADKQAKGKKISDAEKGKLYNMTVDLVSQAVEGGKESVDVPEDDDADVTYGEKDVPEAFRPKQNNMTAEEVSQAMVNATTPNELVEVRNAAKMSTAPGAAAMADKMYKLYSQKMVADESNSYTDVDLYYAENEMSQKDAWLAGANRVNKSGLNLSTKGEIAYNEGQRHRIRNTSSSTADTASLKSFTAETIEQNPKIIDPTTGKELSKSMLQKLDMGTRNILEMAQKQQTTDAANALIQNYEKGVPVGSYQRAFTAFFDQGASGVRTFEEVLSHNNHMLSTMSEDTLKSIYNAGHSQYKALQNKAENNTVVRKGTGTVTDLRTDKSGDLTAMPLYEAYAKKTGLDIEIRDDMQEGINGSFEKSVSKITFNANSKRGHGTFFHEGIGEFASAWNSAGMKEVQDEIIRYAIDTMGTDRFSNAVRRYQSAYNQVEGYKAVRDAMDEYVNDAISGLFETEDGMGKFAKWLDGNHPEKKDTILGKIAEWLDKVIEAMQDLLSGTKRTEAARLVRTMDVKHVEALRQKALDAMDVAIENYQNAAEAGLVEDATDVRNSIDVNKPISNTRDLIAIHNLTMEQLEKTLDLNGFPSPSIAIIKAGMGHSMYGDVSVLFNKSTIDPAASKLNRVYGGDAWTPTFPSIEYKLNAKKLSAVEDKVRGLIPDEVLRSSRTGLSLDLDNATEKVNRWGNFAEAYANSDMLKYAYAMDAGIKVETPMKEARLSSKYQNPEIIGVAELFTKEQLSEMLSGGYTYMNEHPETVQMIEDKLNEIFEKKYEGRRILKGKKLYQDIGFNGWDAAVHGAYKYLDEGIQREADTYKLIEAVDAAIDNDAYSKWVGELFDGVVEKAGIRNGQDTFTRSGNRRSWDSLHDDVSLENIVKAMNREEDKGSNAFFAQSAIQAIATKNFKNVAEIKQSSGQLQNLPEEEYKKIKEEHAQRAAEIVEEIYNTRGSNAYMAKDDAYQAIADALSRSQAVKGIDSALRKWGGLRIKSDTAQKVYDLAQDIANMPTGYFEAKPRRAVYLNEIASVILPDTASKDLLQRLSDAHVPYETYAAGDEAARQAMVDAHEDVRFSVDTEEEEERVTVSNVAGEKRFSVETYKTGGRDYLTNWLRKESGLSEADQEDIVNRLDNALELAERYANGEELPSFSAWSRTGLNKGIDGKLLLQTFGNDGRPVQSVVVNNGEYPLNIDFTQVCKKRTTLNAVLNTLIDQYGLNLRTLTQTDINTVNALIKKHGFEIACGLCFVDAKRYRVGDWSASFANGTYSKTGKKTKRGWNDLVRSMLKRGTTASYFNFATNVPTSDGQLLSDLDDSEIRFTELDNIIRKFAKYDENGNLTGIGRSNDGKNPTELVRMAYLLRTDPSMRHFLNQNDLIASDGLDAMRQNADPLYKLVNAHWGAGKPKLPHGFTAYGNEILRSENWGSTNNFSPEAAYKVGGVRVQSFSDFVANMFFDYMQMFADMAARKLPSHAYTKEIDYVRLFGMTGQKINMSLVPKAAEMTKEQTERYRKLANRGNAYVLADPEFADMAMHAGLAKDENGEWTRYIWEDESFNYDDAMAIQADPRYNKNCGAIAVGVSHDHIMKMLDDDNIPMIIPYHKSGISRNIAILRNVQLYTDYTSQQTTRNANGNVVKKDFDFYGDLAKTNDPIKTAENYKAWCKKNGYTEKFTEFSKHPNYYKLLIDFRVYDYNGSDPGKNRTYQPQGAVTMTFPEKGEFESIVKTALMNQQTTEDRMASELSGDQDSLLAEVKGALGLQENGERYSVDAEAIDLTAGKNNNSFKPNYSLEVVDPVVPTTNGWQRGATYDEVLERFPNLFNTEEDSDKTQRNKTQVKGTVNSYRKYYDILKEREFKGRILDASSGLGYGTIAGREEYGFDVDDIEPYYGANYQGGNAEPKYYDYSKLFETYDAIISNAVLNVIPQDQRDSLTTKMGEMLNPGGSMFINVRGVADVEASKNKQPINADLHEWFIPGSNSYQKGFTHNELIAYLKDVLGEVDYTYTPLKKLSGVVVEVKKNPDAKMDPRYAGNTQPTSSPNIRYSIDIEPLSTDTRYQLEDDDFFALFDGTDHSGEPITGFLDDDLYQGKTQNDFVVEATKILEEGAKAMQGKPVRGVKIKNVTKNIVEEYNVLGDRKVIEDNLTKVFAYLQTHEDVSYADMLGIVQDVAQDIINNSTDVVGSREEYQRAVKSLQTRKIALNAEQKQEVANVYGSYGKFRQATFNVNVFSDKGTPLDNIWSELCDEFGGLLDYDTNTGDQPLKLMDALNAMLPRYEGNRFGKPGSATNKEAAYDLALRIIGSYYGGKSQVSMNDLSKEFRDKVRAEYDEKLRAAKEEIKERARIDIENAKVKYSWAKKADTEGKNAIEKLAELKARNREQNIRKAERQKKAKTTEAISRTVKRLYKKLYEPSKTGYNNHVPTAMQEPLAEFLSVFDFVTPDVTKFESGKDKGKWGARIYDHREGNRNIYHTITADTREEALHKVDEYIYNLMQNGGGSRDSRVWYEKMNALADLLVSENMSTDEQMSRLKMSDALIKVFKDMLSQHSHDQDVLHISQLSAEELDLVEKTIRMIDHAISKENELFSLQRKENLPGLYNQFLADAEERFKRKDKAGNTYKKTHDNYDKPNSAAYDMAWNLTNVHMLNPRTFFKTKGSGAGTMYDVLREGWNARTGDIQTAEKYTTELLDGMKISDWKKEVHTFTSREGKQVKMTVPQIMTLYELQKRPAARNHLPGGFKMSSKVNTVGGVKNVVQDQAVHFDNGLMAQIFEVLTPEQIRVADGLQKFFVDYCSKWNNEVSERLYGFQMFTEPNYFPMHVDKTTVNTNNADVNVLINGIENMGMTKAVKKEALNALIIEDIFDVYVQHVVDSANYHGYAAPISDLLRWFNYRQTSTTNGIRVTQSTKETMKTYYGEASNQYIVKLIQDLNGEAKVDAEGKLSAMLMSHYKAAAVGANVRVAIQQPTAYLRAANVIDMKYLLPALRTNPLKLEEKSRYAMEHNKSAYWKSHGYYDSMLGQSMERIILGESSLLDKLEEGASILAQKGDDWTWGVLYSAVEREIKGQNPGIDVNSEAYRQKVNERFDDVIDQTQVIDSVLHRTQMMRSNNPLVQMEMAFQAEPQKTYNMLYAAVTSGDKKKIMRAVATYISTGMLTAAAAALADAFRDKDESKKWAEKYLASLQANAKDNLNVLSLFPYVKDVISKMDGYDVERVDTQGLMNLVDYAEKLEKWFENHLTGKKNSQTLYGSLKNIVRAASQVFGIPVYNALRTFESVNNTIRQYLNPDFGFDLSTYTKTKSQQDNEQRQKEYMDLYDAIDEGKDPGAVLGQYIAAGKTVKEIKKALEQEYKTMYGDADEDERAAMRAPLLKAYEVLGEENPEDVLNAWAGAAVGYEPLDQTMAVGEGFEDEVQNLLDHGKTLQGIKGHLQSVYGDDLKYRYEKGMDLSDEEELIVDVLVAAGSSVSDAEATLEKWQTGKSSDEYTSKYADIYTAIDDGSLNGLSTAITEALKENEARYVKSSITGHYKDQYLDTRDSALYQRLITAYRQLGMTEEEAKDFIKGWSGEATGGKKVSGMTALYVAIDNGEDLDAALQEALTTKKSSRVMAGVTSTYRDIYVANPDPVLKQRLIQTYMKLGLTEQEATEKLQEWIDEAERGY